MPPKSKTGGVLAYRVALVLHALFEAGVGLSFLSNPGKFFPQLEGRLYSDALRALLRWFSLSIIVQGLVALLAVTASPDRQPLFMLVFLAYHAALVADGLLAIRLTGTTDMPALYVHGGAAVIFIVALAVGSLAAQPSRPKKK